MTDKPPAYENQFPAGYGMQSEQFKVNKGRRVIWSSWKFVKKEWFLTSLCRNFWTKMEIRLQ